MRLPPLSFLAFPLSSYPPFHHQPSLQTAIFIHHRPCHDTNERLKQPTKKRRRTNSKNNNNNNKSKYNHLTTRQKSIYKGNDPIISLNLNLDHLAKSTQPDSAVRAEEMLFRIEALHADGYYERSPDVVSYNCVINAYAHGRGIRDRLMNGERLVARMKDRGMDPNEITYNTLLRCLLREMEGMGYGTQALVRMDMVTKAESILATMEELKLSNTRSYNTMISILSKSQLDDSPQRAEYWLRHMMDQYDTTNAERFEPDTYSFNSVIHAYANSVSRTNIQYAIRAEELLREMESSELESVQPDVVTYSAVINAFAKASSKENEWCIDRAMEIMESLEKNLDSDDKKSVKPNKKTYSAVINAFAKVGNAAAADDVLGNMKKISAKYDTEDLKPDTVCFTSLIDAYAKKGGEDAAARAEELLDEMEDLYNSGDLYVKPNIRTYCAVINALGKSGKPRYAEKAEQILNEMEHMSSIHGLRDLEPNKICYNSVITAYARSSSVSKAHRAELLLERMLEATKNGNTRTRPDTITFNSVINAAAQSNGDDIVKKEAYLIALNAFKTLHGLDYCNPTSVTYSSFLKVLKNLIDDEESRDYMSTKVFGLSVKMGLDNDLVRSQLNRTCSSHRVAQQIIETTTKIV